MLAIPAEIAVAENTAPADIPSIPPKYDGFTARIYAIARNVVIPAIISVLTSVPCSFSLKSFSMVNFLSLIFCFCRLHSIIKNLKNQRNIHSLFKF